MKLLDDQGKIFGLINPLDLAIIIVIVLIGAKVVWNYRPVSPKQKERPVTIGLLVRNVPPYIAESLAIGQDLFDDVSEAYLGKIHTISAQPAELLLPANGRVIVARSPRNLDIRLGLTKMRSRIETGLARSGVYLGKIAARVGNRFQLHTRYTSITGEIILVKIN